MYLDNPSIPTLLENLKQVTIPDDHVLLVLIGEKAELDVKKLIGALNQAGYTFLGGIFPGVIHGTVHSETGIVIEWLPMRHAPVVVHNLNDRDFSIDALEPLREHSKTTDDQPTALILVDGLTPNIALLLSRMFYKFGNYIKYLGGGAGSLSLQQQPCVFDNHGVYQDAAVIALLNTQANIGVRHGWSDMRGPFVANKTDQNVVIELNNKPALEVYRRYVQRASKQTLTAENFFEVAKGFPLGIFHHGVDRIVRDPIMFNDQGLVCVGEVPPRSLVYILTGRKDTLIDYAKRATQEALIQGQKPDKCLVVDCISRVLYLESQFSDDLNGVQSQLPTDNLQAFGMLSLGEIASYGTGRVEFFNKTIVVSTWVNGQAQDTPQLELKATI